MQYPGMETTWLVTVIDRGFEVIFEVDAPTSAAACRAARQFFPFDAKIVKAVRA